MALLLFEEHRQIEGCSPQERLGLPKCAKQSKEAYWPSPGVHWTTAKQARWMGYHPANSFWIPDG